MALYMKREKDLAPSAIKLWSKKKKKKERQLDILKEAMKEVFTF